MLTDADLERRLAEELGFKSVAKLLTIYRSPSLWQALIRRERRLRELEEALRPLIREVRGALSIADYEIRQAIGHTNVACINSRLDEAEAALGKGERDV